MSNLSLWDSVSTTNPNYTKEFNRGGGFKGTAINPTYLARKATEQFGPVGIGWGWEIEKEEILVGAPLTDNCNELIHTLQIKLWFVLEGKRGEVTHFGATTFVGKNKFGLFTDEEAKKKSLTDAIGKCLALLGFSSDVHLGLYDDNKYVNDLRNKLSKEDILKKIAVLTNNKAISDLFVESIRKLGYEKDSENYNELVNVCKKRVEELKKKEVVDNSVTETA